MKMAENSPITSVDHLDVDTVVKFLSLVPNELRGLSLAVLRTDVEVTEAEAYDAIMTEGNGQAAALPIRRGDFGSMMKLNSPEAVVVGHKPNRGLTFTRTAIGELAAALAGHLLNLSKISAVPTGAILGEYKPATSYRDKENIASFEARLIVLHGLFTLAAHKWKRSGRLYDFYEKHGLDEGAASGHLKKLAKHNLVERRARPNPNGGRIFETRLVQTGFLETPELVRRFLTIIGRFAVLDPDFISEGLEYADVVSHDRVYVPGLIQRATFHDSHYRRSNKK